MNKTKDVTRDFKKTLDTIFVDHNVTDLPSDKQKVFISFSSGIERAKTVIGIGNSLKTAFNAAKNSAAKIAGEKEEPPKWIMINVVTKETKTTVEEYYRKLYATRRGYLRVGVAFDDMYNVAFLEQELYANHLLHYESKKVQSFHESNINHYLRHNKLFRGKFSVDTNTPLTLFETKTYFYDTGEIFELDSDSTSLNKGRRAISFGGTQEENSEKLLNLINKTGEQLLSTLNADGSFVYGYFSCFNATVPGYNIVRHALGTFAFADLYTLNNDKRYKEGAVKSLNYIIKENVVEVDDMAFVIEKSPKENVEAEIKLGALGVAVLAITKCMELLPKASREKHLQLLKKLGNGILHMQNEKDGNFVHVLNYPSLTLKEEFRIVYYAGEACFALTQIYALDNDPKWMDSIERAFDFFIANDYHKYSDHWLAYAVDEVTKYKPEDKYFEFGLRNAFYDIDFIIKRDTTWNTFLEMLNASFLFIKRIRELDKDYLLAPYDLDKLKEAIGERFDRQLSSVMFPELAMFFKSPQTILYGVFIRHHTFRVRNDDVAHHMMSYSNLYRIKYLMGGTTLEDTLNKETLKLDNAPKQQKKAAKVAEPAPKKAKVAEPAPAPKKTKVADPEPVTATVDDSMHSRWHQKTVDIDFIHDFLWDEIIIYNTILSQKRSKIAGTIDDLAKVFEVIPEIFYGFLLGIEKFVDVDLKTIKSDDIIILNFDNKKIYKHLQQKETCGHLLDIDGWMQ